MERDWEISKWEREWLWEGLPVLKCRCVLPHFPGNTRAQRRMERLWRLREEQLKAWLEEYYRRCCRRGEAALEASRPILRDLVTVETRVECQREGLLSLLLRLETPERAYCWPELWALGSGVPVAAQTLLPPLQRLRWGRGKLLLTEHGLAVLERTGERRVLPGGVGGKSGKSGKSGESPCTAVEKRV